MFLMGWLMRSKHEPPTSRIPREAQAVADQAAELNKTVGQLVAELRRGNNLRERNT